jgi:rhodanese-related sulfurtransferase
MQFLLENWLLVVAALASGSLLAWPSIAAQLAGPALSQHEATRLINDRDATILDVRDAAQFQAGHLPSARTIPLVDLEKRCAELPTKRPIIVVCEEGRSAAKAAKQLRAQGRADVHVLAGGMVAWRAAGLPVVR